MRNAILHKLPEITFLFWVMKICATTLGETAGDLLSMTMNVGYAYSTIILMSVFLVSLAAQLIVKKFHPALFWTVILSTSTAGTTLSDYMDRTLGLGYAMGSSILTALLITMLWFWRWREGSIAIQTIKNRRVECYYWASILISNTLGTALGDYLADSSGLGFAGGALLISSVIAFITALYYSTSISRVALFWAAFVLTRPLGATMGDLMTKPLAKGGFDLGTIGSSAVLGAVLVALILYTNFQHKKSAHV